LAARGSVLRSGGRRLPRSIDETAQRERGRLLAAVVVRRTTRSFTLTQLVLGHEPVPDHPLPDRAVALGQGVDEVLHQLDVELPLREVAGPDGVVEVLGVRTQRLGLHRRGIGAV
jgi:hypothetical protein